MIGKIVDGQSQQVLCGEHTPRPAVGPRRLEDDSPARDGGEPGKSGSTLTVRRFARFQMGEE
jgi:hypothetical protein